MKLYRQGNVLLAEARREDIDREMAAEADSVLARGKTTGNSHRVEGPSLAVWETPQGKFVDADAPFRIVHEEHATIDLPAGCYRMVLQREYDENEIRDPVHSAAIDAAAIAKIEQDLIATVTDVLACTNREIRQKALKRLGYENFARQAGMKEIDRVGENALLRRDDIVLAHVKDDSTPRRYYLRVPPDMQTLHEAIAWTFRMRPEEYRPLAET